MTQPSLRFYSARNRAGLLVGAVALLCSGLFGAASASAAYEGVGHFAGSATPVAEEKFSEEVELSQVGGMAVNYTGAGGVPPGTVYAIAKTNPFGSSVERVAMFTPSASGLEFRLGWTATASAQPSYERCGPAVGTECGSVWRGDQPTFADVDINQTTGNVYVYLNTSAGFRKVVEYTPDGSAEITSFGKQASSKTIAEDPEEHHRTETLGSLAVNDSGDVYITDYDGEWRRLMVFEPQTPGDYTHYVYAGEVDGAKGFLGQPQMPVTDAAGNIYVAQQEFGTRIEEFAPETPSSYPAPPAKPICEFTYPKGGFEALTVNHETGEVFFTSYKTEAGFKFKLIHQLSPCDEETGKFKEVGKFEIRPERGDVSALAFDPVRRFESTRPPGTLYAGAPGPIPASGVGNGEKGQSSLGYIFARPQALPPSVEDESVGHVTATAAQLRAQINPKGSVSRYAFQYETLAAYEANNPTERFAGAGEAPVGGTILGLGVQEALPAAASVAGLSPDTEYRYRVVATSNCSAEEPETVCEGVGAAQGFRTFPVEAPGLPDGRVWEMVSPSQKNGGEVFPIVPGRARCNVGCRKPEFATAFPMQSAPDGEAIVYEGQPFSASEGAVAENEYLARRDPQSGWQSIDLSPELAIRGSSRGYKAFSTDLSHGLLSQENPALSPDAPSGYENLYTQPSGNPLTLNPLLTFEPPDRGPGKLLIFFAGASADLSRIFFRANDALTPETPVAPEAVDGGENKFNLYEWHEGSLALVNVMPGNAVTEAGASFGDAGAHSISDDGSRVFFEDESHQVYVRIDGEESKAISTEGSPDSARFLAASADGSKVLLQNGHLHDLEGDEATVDLTEGKGGFQGVSGQSDDLSHVYFVDTKVLDETPSQGGEKAEEGKNNLYAWTQDKGTRFVATLAPEDNAGNGTPFDWAPSPSLRTAEASPSGRYLAFFSYLSLTGYDSTTALCGSYNGAVLVSRPCPEAFLYDSATGKIDCASCDPSEATPLGFTFLPPGDSHYLTDEGRLYFDTRDSLVPADTNNGVEDVYEYEPGGAGDCGRPGGCTRLISSGHEPTDSNFLAIDEDGKNVFFTTRDQLSLKDKDDAVDLYDAREGGGIPSETEISRGECQGEACQVPVSPPNDPTPGSSTFEGAGNVNESKAAKKHPKKHKKKRQAKKKHAHKRAAKHNRGGVK